MREYDLIAEWYASERIDTTTGGGVPEAVAMAAALPHGSRVLDVGCGNGVHSHVMTAARTLGP